MRIDSRVGLASAALWLPAGRCTTEDALVDGVLTADQDVPPGVDSVPEGQGESAEDMAAQAVLRALAGADRPMSDVDLLAYAWAVRCAEHPYSPPHRLAKQLSAGDCLPVGLLQGCNGGAAAVETAVTRMLTDERVRVAVAVTSDTFAAYGSRRWTEPTMMVVGDGAAAVVLVRGPGRLALVAMATSGHTCADIMEAGQDIRVRAPGAGGFAARPSDRSLSEAAHSVEYLGHCVNRAVRHALADAGLEAGDPGISAVLLPRLADPFTESFVRPALPEPLRSKARIPDPHTGHLGAGDTLANLEYALRCAMPAPGEHLLVVNGGQGVAASCLVLAPGTG
ncbi:ketoacyl-ACP synthase III family protein [Streptomyces syringium]|uniref:3-oxoacyl-[acyl-carrier-protein] synthase-3 n=1 Tax=Streptomyces syringium TaxID=76729 RepID=A0ABS4YCK2_9ACTN|nr:ketoacyl-ACP synthase III family protein [Streptomyces syringium]MBP2406518.1 3-oxoacyl-[acyl-carrier-protein] synthase-3 [Streptomyces syringium]